ncbi:MAG TPA: hypothetical protein O0X25_04010 [Methanocorpusculum sp.]|nr:hypothetical protein [Methanocorpusculum sp.]HJJ57399.1 hypothetical protein [Methanocorpusculum sp.]
MTEIRVNVSALIAAREALKNYGREMADAIANCETSASSISQWNDEDFSHFTASVKQLYVTVSDLQNEADTLAKRIDEKTTMVNKNKSFKVW